jgi:hypothetical protein
VARIPTRFHGPAAVSNAAATKLTVAANESAIIRNIHVYNPGAGTVNFTASIGADAAGTRIFDAYPVLEDVPLDHWCYYVLAETEVLQALGSVNNQLVLTIDGDRIVLG